MMMLARAGVLFGTLMFTVSSQAATIIIPDVKIGAVRTHGFTIEIELAAGTQLSTGCAATDQQRIFSRTSATYPIVIQYHQTQALYAHAQNLSVDIYYDNTICNSGGRELESIRVRPILP